MNADRTIHRGDAALGFLSETDCVGGAHVSCPNCASDFTHVVGVGTLLGSDEWEASVYRGTAVTGATAERRSAVEIVFDCEQCDQLFGLVIQQSKGVNYVEVHQNVRPCGKEELDRLTSKPAGPQ